MDRHAVSAIATLDDDVRRALFGCVRDSPGPITREAAAQSVGISRKLAAFHLDKLVEAGLLQARVDAGGARRVGRAPKVYEPSGDDVGVSIPQREHAMLAEVLVAAIQDASTSADACEGAVRVAGERGEQEGAAVREQVRPGRLGIERAARLVAQVLARHGFEPARTGNDVLLRNCPFHPLAASAPEVVCKINHAYLSGVLRGLGADSALCTELAPEPGQCCVAFRARTGASRV